MPRTLTAPLVAAATLLTAMLVALLLSASAHATPALPRALFDPAETGWLSLRDQTSAAYAARFDELKKTRMLIDLDVDVIDNSYRVGSVWRPVRRTSAGRSWREQGVPIAPGSRTVPDMPVEVRPSSSALLPDGLVLRSPARLLQRTSIL